MEGWLNGNNVYFHSANFFIVSLMVCIFWQLQGMDEPAQNLLPLKMTLVAQPDYFNREMVRCLSMVNKYCEEMVRETVQYRMPYNADYRAWVLNSDSESRKQYFIDLNPHLKSIPNLVWNKHGTICALASFGPELNWCLYEKIREKRDVGRAREVMMERYHCLKPEFIGNCAVREHFYGCLPYRPVISFDVDSTICIHACGAMNIQDPIGVEVLEYRLTLGQGSAHFVCMAEVGKKIISLANFLEFPKLLQAFLESSETKFSVGLVRKIFVLEGVTLPDDYDECKIYYEQTRYHQSFKDLPSSIRKAIFTHYLAQKGKPKKSKWACFGL